MSTHLKVKFPKKCIGCELCVFESQRQLKKVGLDGSIIRILRDREKGQLEFFVELDPRVDQLDIHSIRDICPTSVFEIEEESNGTQI